jgi:hypothetical protein
MNNKEFQKCIDNYINMLVKEPTFNERQQRQELHDLTGYKGKALDDLYKRIGEAIWKPERTYSTRL